jgi:hypothetical protein
MKRASRSLQMLKSRLWHRAQKEKDKERKEDYRLMHEIAQDTEAEYNKMFGEIEMQMLRNPAFPDDYVGYTDEDIKLFNEIEEENRKKQNDKDE